MVAVGVQTLRCNAVIAVASTGRAGVRRVCRFLRVASERGGRDVDEEVSADLLVQRLARDGRSSRPEHCTTGRLILDVVEPKRVSALFGPFGKMKKAGRARELARQ